MKAISCPTAPLSAPEWQDVDADRVIDGAPRTAHSILHASASGEFNAGIYQSTRGKWRISYTEDEFCTLIEGRVRLTNDAGEIQEYAAPDSFIIPAGYQGTWESLSDVRKFFVIYEKTA